MSVELDLVTEGITGDVSHRRRVAGVGDAMKVHLSSRIAGEDFNNDYLATGDADDEYKLLIAATADQVCGSVGAVGDYLGAILLNVGAAGTLVVKDSSTAIFTFAFAGAITTPLLVRINKRSVLGGWKVSTGTSMTGFAGGRFS